MKKNKNRIKRVITVIIGIIINCVLGFITYKTGLPLYMDTVGTIGATMIGGALPGIVVGVLSNIVCGCFNNFSMYFSLVSAITVVCTLWFIVKYKNKKKIRVIIEYVFIITLVNGVFGTIIQYILFNRPQFEVVSDLSAKMASGNVGMFFAAMLINIVFNLIDKTLSVLIALAIIHFIPEKLKNDIWYSGWKQKLMQVLMFRWFICQKR